MCNLSFSHLQCNNTVNFSDKACFFFTLETNSTILFLSSIFLNIIVSINLSQIKLIQIIISQEDTGNQYFELIKTNFCQMHYHFNFSTTAFLYHNLKGNSKKEKEL